MAEPLAFKIAVRNLAADIYVDMVSRSMVVTEGKAAVPAGAENLAHLSFKLAQAFQDVEDELNAASLPKNQGFQVDVGDIAQWTK